MIQHRETVPTQFLIALAVLFGILSVAADPQRTASTAVDGESDREVSQKVRRFIRLDPRFDRLVPPSAVLEKITEGLRWVEGPVWNHTESYLLFSDIPDNAVFRWEPGKGLRLFLQPSGYTGAAPFAGREPGSNGLAFDRQGRLVLAEHGDRRIARLEADGSKTTLADRYQGKRLN